MCKCFLMCGAVCACKCHITTQAVKLAPVIFLQTFKWARNSGATKKNAIMIATMKPQLKPSITEVIYPIRHKVK